MGRKKETARENANEQPKAAANLTVLSEKVPKKTATVSHDSQFCLFREMIDIIPVTCGIARLAKQQRTVGTSCTAADASGRNFRRKEGVPTLNPGLEDLAQLLQKVDVKDTLESFLDVHSCSRNSNLRCSDTQLSWRCKFTSATGCSVGEDGACYTSYVRIHRTQFFRSALVENVHQIVYGTTETEPLVAFTLSPGPLRPAGPAIDV